jgi:glutathione S-transferase
MFANLSRALGGGGGGSSAAASATATFADAAPSWEELATALAAARTAAGLPAGPPDYANGPTSPLASVRLFGSTGEPRVLLYRDHAGWCPYCEKVWLQLEEKRIPYRIEKINMRCYGDKPPAFLAKVPSGLLPAMELDGKLYTESAVIAALLEEKFPEHSPLLPAAGSAARSAAEALFRLERQLFSRWLGWLTRAGGDAAGRAGLEEALRAVEAALAARGGPYFLGCVRPACTHTHTQKLLSTATFQSHRIASSALTCLPCRCSPHHPPAVPPALSCRWWTSRSRRFWSASRRPFCTTRACASAARASSLRWTRGSQP